MKSRFIAFLSSICVAISVGSWVLSSQGSMLVDAITPLEVLDGLDGWWKFDEGSGLIANDISGSGYDGTLVDGAAFSNDWVDVGGDDPVDHVVLPASATLAGSTAFSLTCEFWPVSANSEWAFIFSESTGTAGFARFELRYKSSTKLTFIWRDAAAGNTGAAKMVVHTTALAYNTQWYFLAVRFDSDADTVDLTIDDTTVDYGSTTGPIGTATSASINFGLNSGSVKDRTSLRIRNCKRFDRYISDDEMNAIRAGH